MFELGDVPREAIVMARKKMSSSNRSITSATWNDIKCFTQDIHQDTIIAFRHSGSSSTLSTHFIPG
jgi:hypothetical protein